VISLREKENYDINKKQQISYFPDFLKLTYETECRYINGVIASITEKHPLR